MFLGIDAGTSKVAAVIVDARGGLAASASLPHHADQPAPPGHSEQDAEALAAAAWRLVRELPVEARRRVEAVGITGQMHGCALLDAAGRAVTPLYTWQDQRCEQAPGFLADLAARTGHRLSSGFAPATIAWLAARGAVPRGAEAAAIISDLLAQRLCALPRPVTDASQAASWGLLDLRALAWDEAAIGASGVPRRFFPEVVPCGSAAGELARGPARALGLPAGVPVASLGDNQASMAAALSAPQEQVLLTLGTGGQLSAVLPRGTLPQPPAAGASWEHRPYVDGLYAAVAASLAGGSAWKWLASLCSSWARDLGTTPPGETQVYELLNSLGAEAADSGSAAGLVVSPSLLAERHDPLLRGRIEGIELSNMGLGALAWALAQGIVRNLRDMVPAEILRGRTAVVGTGNALRRNPLLRRAAEAVFCLRLGVPESHEEAAVGAALVASRLVRKHAAQDGGERHSRLRRRLCRGSTWSQRFRSLRRSRSRPSGWSPRSSRRR